MIAVWGFILVVCALGGYGFYELYRYFQRKHERLEKGSVTGDQANIHKIIELVFDKAHSGTNKTVTANKVSKVGLMESLDLKPQRLKALIERLERKEIVKQQDDTVTITPFGVQFFKVFRSGNGKPYIK